MNLNVETIEGVAVVTLPGRFLNASNHEQFMAAVTPILETNAKVILDVDQLESIDSSGLGAFAFCMRKMQDTNGSLKLCSPTPAVRTAFGLVHMNRMVEAFDTRQDALRAMSN